MAHKVESKKDYKYLDPHDVDVIVSGMQLLLRGGDPDRDAELKNRISNLVMSSGLVDAAFDGAIKYAMHRNGTGDIGKDADLKARFQRAYSSLLEILPSILFSRSNMSLLSQIRSGAESVRLMGRSEHNDVTYKLQDLIRFTAIHLMSKLTGLEMYNPGSWNYSTSIDAPLGSPGGSGDPESTLAETLEGDADIQGMGSMVPGHEEVADHISGIVQEIIPQLKGVTDVKKLVADKVDEYIAFRKSLADNADVDDPAFSDLDYWDHHRDEVVSDITNSITKALESHGN